MVGVFDLFSKRNKKQNDEEDVYQYEEIPQKLKVQIVHIFQDILNQVPCNQEKVYYSIHKILCKEYGVFSLGENYQNDDVCIYNFLLESKDYKEVLDITEIFYRYTQSLISQYFLYETELKNAIDELNYRFKENAVGYTCEGGKIIRIDSKFIHKEVIKPVINILNGKLYKGANDEFLKAHEHYRYKKYKECLNECLKAFESTMKIICDKHSWNYNQNDTSKKLIKICFDNDLIPSYLQAQFSSLQQLFESGIPTIRNKNSGHGQGVEDISVSEEMASYMLHLTATNILFLVEHEKKI
jgi:hypothetical protein